MSITLKQSVIGLSVAAALASTTSYAQIDEIIVTANKREQTLQEVPIAVSVVSAETIERDHIVDLFDMQSVVPSFEARQYQTSANATFFIRGFGNGSNNPGVEPSVSVYIDGVYRSRMQGQMTDLPNVERVEILRGPQNTIFGKNASAGVVNIVTKKASFEKEGMLKGEISNYNGRKIQGYFSGPISESTAVSLSVTKNERDGYTKTSIPGNTDINNINRESMRGEIFSQVTDSVQMRLIADYDTIDEVCCTVGNLVPGPVFPALQAYLGATQVPGDPYTYTYNPNFDPLTQADNKGVSFNIEADLGFAMFSMITADRTSRTVTTSDVDFDSTPIINLGTDPNVLDLAGFSHEMRLASNGDDLLNWQVGAFYQSEDLYHKNSLKFGPGFRTFAEFLANAPGAMDGVELALGLPAGSIFAQGQGTNDEFTQDNNSLSLFGEVEVAISDKLTATVGLSYFTDEKTVTYSQSNDDIFSDLDLPAILTYAGLLAGLPLDQAIAAANANPLMGFQALQFLPQRVPFPNGAQDGKSDDSNLDYSLKLSYALNEAVTLYGGVATGYKASAWNMSNNSAPDQAEYDGLVAAGASIPNNLNQPHPHQTLGTRGANPEESTVYELGAKIILESGYLNVTIFDQTIKDFQSNTFVGNSFVLANAGKQTAKGLEFDLLYRPMENIDFTLSGTFLDPVYDEFVGSAAGDISGRDVEGVHKESVATSVTWNWESGSLDGYVRAGYQYDSPIIIRPEPGYTELLEAYGHHERERNLLNMSAGVNFDNMSVTLWGKNLTNDKFLVTAFPAVANTTQHSGYPNAPRTYGLTVTMDF